MTEPSQYFKGRTVQEQMNEVIGYVDTRAAEVATTAIASDVAQVHQDMLDADADASAAAASAAAAAGTLANAVKKTGEASQSIAGDIAVSGTLSGGVVTGTVITAPNPVNNTDAANKKYVDDADALNVKLAGNQTVNGVKTFGSSPVVPTVATGTADTKAANGTKVKNELDAYAQMVRTVNAQTIAGSKNFTSDMTLGTPDSPDTASLIIWSSGAYRRLRMRSSTDDYSTTPASDISYGLINWCDKNDQSVANLVITHKSTGGYKLVLSLRKSDGTFTNVTMGETS